MIKKVNFIVNQIIGSGLFLGYSASNWNPKINYFLLGKYRGVNLFNANHIYSYLKSFVLIISDILAKKGRIWVVNEKFDLFFKSNQFLSLSGEFEEVRFVSNRWLKGSLTNHRYIRLSKPSRFPHALVVPNLQNNRLVVNEAFLINIPSFSLVDTVDNPSDVFFPIPGNSKSIRTAYFFYLLVSKAALYSRYIVSSSFIFNSYKRFASKKKNLANFNFIFDFLKKYEYISKTFYLFEENIYLLLVKFKKKKFFLKKASYFFEKFFERTEIFARFFLLWVFTIFFLNILKLTFLKFKAKANIFISDRSIFYKTLVRSIA